jgi:hypothetical protein
MEVVNNMVMSMGWDMGPDASQQYDGYMNGSREGYTGGRGGYIGGGGGGGNQHNMQAQTPYAPQNNGGPGNPNGANNMAKPLLPRFNPGFQNNKGPAPLTPNDVGYNGSGINPPIPRADNFYRRPSMGGDPFNQYGFAGQSPSLGRYQPPMMSNPNDPSGGWLGGGGYAYNIPNSYGSGQWNQFNSTDRPSRNFGQTQNLGNFARDNIRYSQPMYQSPFANGDPSRSQNYFAYLSTLGQQPQQPRYTQPGTPDQPAPVV